MLPTPGHREREKVQALGRVKIPRTRSRRRKEADISAISRTKIRLLTSPYVDGYHFQNTLLACLLLWIHEGSGAPQRVARFFTLIHLDSP